MTDECYSLPYSQTGSFSKLAIDYASGHAALKPFYEHETNEAGLLAAIAQRQQFNTNRTLLAEALQLQYKNYELTAVQQRHLDALLQENTFTITTAHQPNIFTGPLYFIYKILHAIKLAEESAAKWPQYNFVPVYYMGSEDADLDELGYLHAGNEKLVWETQQVGAVGRMNTEGLAKIIDKLKGEFGFLEFGAHMAKLIEEAYLGEPNIQLATLRLVNSLFSEFGLLVVIPDSALLKSTFKAVIAKELTKQFSSKLVSETIVELQQHYKVQAAGRDINLFYLFDDGRRERIEKIGDKYRVLFSDLYFSEAEMMQELELYPERFSPNVILRGVFQETILPNIAFIGGGGELAYWLELKKVFETVGVPYPQLLLRNSFLLVDEKSKQLQKKLGISVEELFMPLLEQQDIMVQRKYGNVPQAAEQKQQVFELYRSLQEKAGNIDPTLQAFVGALHARTLQGIEKLEKKMQRAERRKLVTETRQLEQLKKRLFPGGSLQERRDNFLPLFAFFGPELLKLLYKHSFQFEQQFAVLYLPDRVELLNS